MSAQKIDLRSPGTELNVAGNQTTGITEICNAQTTGTLEIGGNPTRSGTIQIGHADGTHALLLRASAINAIATGGDLIVGTNEPGASAIFGDPASDNLVRIGPGTTSASVFIANNQTSGRLEIANNPSRSGVMVIGHNNGTHLMVIRSRILDMSSSSGDATFGASGTTGTVFLGTPNGNATVRVGNGLTSNGLIVGSQQTSGVIAIGANAARTGDISLGSGTGTHATIVRGGSYRNETLGDHTTTVGGDMTTTVTGDRTVTVTGADIENTLGARTITATGDVTIGTTDTAQTTFLGHPSTDAEVRVGNGVTTDDIVIGSNQESGTLALGWDTSRTGSIILGSNSATHATNIRGGSFLVEMSGDHTTTVGGNLAETVTGNHTTTVTGTRTVNTTGAVVENNSGDLTMTASGDVTIGTTGTSNTLFLGGGGANQVVRLGNGVTDKDIVVASAQTSGTFIVGANPSRSGNISFGSGTGTHETLIRGGSYRNETLNNHLMTVGGVNEQNSVANTNITSSGGNVTIGTTNGVQTTFIGHPATDATLRLGSGATSKTIHIGEAQTSGPINIGTSASRTGAIQIGDDSASHPTFIRGGAVVVGISGNYTGSFGGNNVQDAEGDTTIRSLGDGSDILIAATGVGGETIIGDTSTTTRIGPGSGIIAIGDAFGRTAVMSIGHELNNADLYIRSNDTFINDTGRGAVTIGAARGFWTFYLPVTINGVAMTNTYGDFTPTIGSAATNYSTTLAEGSWHKWGNMISYTFRFVYTNTNSASGDLLIKGLPFTQPTAPTDVPFNPNPILASSDWSWSQTFSISVINNVGQTTLKFLKANTVLNANEPPSSGNMRASITVPHSYLGG